MARWQTSLLALALVGLPAQVAAAEERAFNVPGGALSTALPQLSRQAGVSISVADARLWQADVRPVRGRMDVQDALKHPELFPAPEDPSRAAVHNCPSGWNCQVSTANLYKALNAEGAGFDLIDTGSAAGLDGSIANAFENKTGWLGYYWAPTAILGKYEMTKLSFGVEHDKKEWDACTAIPDCPSPKVNAYPVSDVYTVVTKAFAEKAGVAMDYMKTRQWDNQTVGKVLAWMVDNQGTNEDGAKHFLETNEEMWTKWVTPEVAEKVKASL